jgi:hypothetical protein
MHNKLNPRHTIHTHDALGLQINVLEPRLVVVLLQDVRDFGILQSIDALELLDPMLLRVPRDLELTASHTLPDPVGRLQEDRSAADAEDQERGERDGGCRRHNLSWTSVVGGLGI